MAKQEEIKHHLTSIKTTRKITKAMQLVASIKFKKSMSSFVKIQEYYTSVYEIFHRLFSKTKNLSKMLPNVSGKGTLFVLITSNLGLCGAYIANVMRRFYSEFKPGDKVMVLGTKGIANLKAHNIPIFREVTNFEDEPKYENASLLGLEAISGFINGEVSEVKLIYTKFINSITFETTLLTLMPLNSTDNVLVQKDHESSSSAIVEFEPSPEKVIKESIKLYISAIIFGAMIESKTSEMASRRTAMENATDNADELIEKLNVEYNRARQAAITQEINEIVAGVEAS